MTKSQEWYTPAVYIEAARRVMGGIELDPASCELANRTVKATRYYTSEDDGLAQDWQANTVWMNPPYGLLPGRKSMNRAFHNKMIESYERGAIKEGILLAKADPKQPWFIDLWEHPICFAFQRAKFYRPEGEPSDIQYGTCFVYFGPNEDKFIEVFSQHGIIARKVNNDHDEVEEDDARLDQERTSTRNSDTRSTADRSAKGLQSRSGRTQSN